MRSDRMASSLSSISPAACWAAALLIVGLIDMLWFVFVDDSAWGAVVPAAVPLVTGAIGISRQRSRALKRLRAVLDEYADREIARRKMEARHDLDAIKGESRALARLSLPRSGYT
jgi:hypothetical protein